MSKGSTRHETAEQHVKSIRRATRSNRLNGDVLNSFLRCVGHGQIRP